MIPDKVQFTKPQKATLVVQQTQTQSVSTVDFTNPALRYEIDPNKQTVTVRIPPIGRPVKIMGAGTATAYKDGHTEQDPARYSFAHGGKDATPYPVDCKTYDETIAMLGNVVRKTKLPLADKQKALSRLNATGNSNGSATPQTQML